VAEFCERLEKMSELVLSLSPQSDGKILVVLMAGGKNHNHVALPEKVAEVQEEVGKLRRSFEVGGRPLVDPVSLADLGGRLRDAFLESFRDVLAEAMASEGGRLLISTNCRLSAGPRGESV
jgi:hypothetical protein